MYTIAPPYPALHLMTEPGAVAKYREQWFRRRQGRRASREPVWPPVDVERLRAELELKLVGHIRYV